MRVSPSAWTVAGGSHQKLSGDAAWIPPPTIPQTTGTRTVRNGARDGSVSRRQSADAGIRHPREDCEPEGRGNGQGEERGRPPRPPTAGQLKVPGGVFDVFGGGAGGGAVGVGGEAAEHRVEAALTSRPLGVRQLDNQSVVGGPAPDFGVHLVGGAGAGHEQPILVGSADVGRVCAEVQAVSGRDGAPGGDRHGADGQGVGVELEGGGSVDLTDAVQQADADGGPEPREEDGAGRCAGMAVGASRSHPG